MKKILLFVACFGFVFTSLIAQPTFTDPLVQPTVRSAGIESSPRARATANTMLSDSDKITADKIHEINKTYFSGGYTRENALSGFWAMPLMNNMTFGIAGEYNMAAYRVDSYTDPVGGGIVTFNKEVVENSAFDVRAVFAIEQLGFSYQLSRSALPYTVVEDKTISLTGEILKEEITKTNGKESWNHEIGFAYRIPDSISIFSTLDVRFNKADLTTSKIIDKTRSVTTDSDTETILEENNDASVELALNPSVSIPMHWWKMTNIDTGINVAFDIYNPGKSSLENIKYSGKNIYGNAIESVETISTEKNSSFSLGIFGKPTFEWNVLDNVVTVIAEPQLSVMYKQTKEDSSTMNQTITTTTHSNEVTTVTTPQSGVIISNNQVKTNFGTNVGFEVKPKEWFTFRAGLKYVLLWDTMTIINDYSLSGSEAVTEHEYAFSSKLTPELGIAFDIEDTFLIDIVLTATTGIDLMQLDSYDIQLSCRF